MTARRPSAGLARGLAATIHRGDAVVLDDVRPLLEEQVGESLWHDYKRGSWLEGKSIKARLQKAVSGFANAEGGLLIVGAADGTKDGSPTPVDARWSFTGCEAPGGAAAFSNWLSNVMNSLVGVCRWQVQTIDLSDADYGPVREGPILALIAVERSERLVHCAEGGAVVTYLRSNESTFRAPEYLLNDILVGRRRRPTLELAADCQLNPNDNFIGIGKAVQVRWEFALDNTSFAWSDGVMMGLVSYTVRQSNRVSFSVDPAPSVLSSIRDRGCIRGGLVQSRRPGGVKQGLMELTSQLLVVENSAWKSPQPVAAEVSMGPLASGFRASGQAFIAGDFDDGIWCAGVHLLERSSRPRWFQLVVHAGGGATSCRELEPGRGPVVFYGPHDDCGGGSNRLLPSDRVELGF